MKRAIITLSLFTLLSGVWSTPMHAAINNGGFEAGFSGWTKLDQTGSDGTFAIQTGTTSPVNAFTVPAPPQGTAAAMTDAMGPGSHVLYQDFVVPIGSGPFFLSFSTYIGNGQGASDFFTPALTTLDFSTAALNQQARADILTTAADAFSIAPGDVLQNLQQTASGDPLVSGYTNHLVDVTTLFQAHQGETLRLRFADVDNVSPMNFGVDAVALVSGSSATKTVSGTFMPGGAIVYTITLTNGGFAQADNAGDEFTDILPSQLTLVSASATSGAAVATVATNTVTWNGALAAGSSVTITINATIHSVAGGSTISNQGTFSYDSDGNGSNDTSALTDDPAASGTTDPTSFVVGAAAPAASIPALDGLGLVLVAVSLAIAAALRLHR